MHKGQQGGLRMPGRGEDALGSPARPYLAGRLSPEQPSNDRPRSASLAQMVNAMDRPIVEESLRDYSERLEAQVAARTAELTRTNEELEYANDCLEEEIGKRWIAEALLRTSEQEKKAILNGLVDVGVGFIGPDLRILWGNTTLGQQCGLPHEELFGKLCYQAMHGRGTPCPDCLVKKAIQTGEVQRGEVTLPDGRIWLVSSNPVRHENGRVAGVVHATLDITERKQAERQLARYAADLAEANAALAKSMAQAQEASLAKSAFLANMSHEIRTPMTAIMGFADLLREQAADTPAHEALETIRRNGEFLLGLIDDILDLSKLEAGRLRIEESACSPVEVVEDILRMMSVRAESKGLALACHCRRPMPAAIRTDPLRLRQILVKLVGNAIKFTSTGGVRVEASLDTSGAEPRICFDVTDTGIGIPDTHREDLFEPFFQVDHSTCRRYGGSGLGLSISRRLARALGGDIRVESRPGRGSTFTVTLPIGSLDGVPMLDRAAGDAADDQPPDAPPRPDIRLDGRILLVEDGRDNQRLIGLILKKAGAEVTVAENGREALELAWPECELRRADLDAPPFDLILMDMQMPVMDGYDATRELRGRGYSGPIVALTAHAMSHDRQKCLDAGCDEFISKPIDRTTFLATIAQYVPAPSAQCPPR